MSAIITDQLRILNAENFVSAATSTVNSYYSFVGLPNATNYSSTWDSNPPAPKDSFEQENDYWDTMIALKKITPSDIRRMCNKYTWTSGITYDMYKNNYDINNDAPQTSAKTLYESRFYVVNSEFKVYICINNGANPDFPDGRPSQFEPTFIDTSPQQAGDGSDGYLWKYLFTVSPSDIIKFDSTEFITVPNSWNSSQDSQIRSVRENGNSEVNQNQIKHVYIESAGSGYANGLSQEVDIIGDGEGAKARVDIVNGTITDVTVSAGGRGYSYGIVDLGNLSSGVSTSTGRAKLVPIIPPSLGHGHDLYTELGTDRVIVYARFDDSTKDFPIDTKFSQVGVVKNPTKVGTSVTYTDNTYSSLQAVKFDSVTGVPQVGEEVKQVLTVSPNVGKVATAYVASYDSETKVLKYFRDRSLNFNRTTFDQTDYAGISTAGRIYNFESQIGANNIEGKQSFFSGAISRNFSGITTNPTGNKLINLGVNFISGLSNSEINKGSGEVVYLDNRPLIVRNSRQKEDIKIILEF